MHFSQSYDIGKMNVKYSPGSEMQVRNINIGYIKTVYTVR